MKFMMKKCGVLIMRDPERIPKVLAAIEKVWSKYPDLRLAQLLLNIKHPIEFQYYMEDEILLYALSEVYPEVDI